MKRIQIMLYISCIVLIFSVISSCATQKQKQQEAIINYINKNFKNINKEKENCIFIISENGCTGCNKGLSKIACQFIDMNNIYFIINAKGTIVDISPYWEAKRQENISYDTTNYFNNNALNYSYAIFVKNNEVDTIIESTAEDFIEKSKYIEQRIIKNK